MRSSAGSEERQGYATALAGLWSDLSRTLSRLEAVAGGSPERLEDEGCDELPVLQYALHRAGELAHGIAPPQGAENAHAELAAALADARDATAEVVEALETGGAGSVQPLVHEWRGTLFRVRLARLRLASRPVPAPAAEPTGDGRRAAVAPTLLLLSGGAAFAAGLALALWPVWAVGVLLLAGGFAVERP